MKIYNQAVLKLEEEHEIFKLELDIVSANPVV